MGSSGGGGSSGEVDYPDYIKEIHSDWLDKGDGTAGGGVDTIEKSITEVMDSALGASPWGASAVIYNPDPEIANYMAQVQAFGAMLGSIQPAVGWEGLFVTASESIGAPREIEVADVDIDSMTIIADEEVDDIADISDLTVDDADEITDAEILLDVAAFADQLDDEILTKVLPRFRRGMQDINAVVSSSFVLGQSNIEGFRDRDVARHSSTLRVNAALKNADIGMANMGKDVQVGIGNLNKDLDIAKANSIKDTTLAQINTGKNVELTKANFDKDVQQGLANMKKDVQVSELISRFNLEYNRLYLEGAQQLTSAILQLIKFDESFTRMTVEANRISIVAQKEYHDGENTRLEEDATWDLEVFQYGANVLASVSGGTMGTKAGKKPPLAASVLGGAMSGAAAGTMVSPGYGTIIGAVLGAAMGLMAGS